MDPRPPQRRAWVVAEPGYEALLERFARGCDAAPAHRRAARAGTHSSCEEEDPASFRAGGRPRARVHRRGRCVPGQPVAPLAGTLRPAPIDPAALYRRLRAANPSPFAALMRDGDFAVISSSPERLLSIRGGIVSTRPIAGTRPRGASRRARCRADRIPARQREGARGARHADRSGAQRSGPGLRRRLGAGR